MPVAAHLNDALGIRVHNFTGNVTPEELMALAQFYRTTPALVKNDLISIVDPDARGEQALVQHLEKLRTEFRQLHMSSDLVVVRRSAWVCSSPGSFGLLERWLNERHSRDGQGTEVTLVPSIADTAPMFEPDEIAAVTQWRDFRELFRSGAA